MERSAECRRSEVLGGGDLAKEGLALRLAQFSSHPILSPSPN